MSSTLCRSTFALFAFFGLLVLPTAAAAGLSGTYDRLPLHFEENRGQVHEDVRFLARGPGYGLYLTASEAVLVLGAKDPAVLRMALVGANSGAAVSGLEELPGKANYFIGKEPSKWRTNVPTYAKVRYREVYPGIDLVYYGNQRQFEYDFVVAPGADPNRIALRWEGANSLEIDVHGDLVLHAARGAVRMKKPVVYQDINGVQQRIEARYVVSGSNRVGIDLAAYDAGKPLVIDPVLAYSTYLGGIGEDRVSGIAVDANGNVYLTGKSGSINFPTTLGGSQPALGGSFDAFVTKLNPAGSALVYSTYLGGSSEDQGSGIAVDAAGNAYVTGATASANFPTTAEAFQSTLSGFQDAFVAKINPTGSALTYATLLGGSGDVDWAAAIAVDAAGNGYVTGTTNSRDFPTTPGAFQPAFAGHSGYGAYNAFVTKLNATATGLAYSTYLGGRSDRAGDAGAGIAVDANGNAYVTGWTSSANFPTTAGTFQPALAGSSGIPTDAYVTKLNSDGSALRYSTFLGGTDVDRAHGIAVDGSGNAFVTGTTSSTNFPMTPGAFQPGHGGAFVTKLDPGGSTLTYSTYLGGPGGAVGKGIAVDAPGRAHVTGETYMTCGQFSCVTGFPTTPDAFQRDHGGAASDAFVSTLDPTGSSLMYSTYLGGNGADGGLGIAVDTSGGIYVAGWTNSGNFPSTVGAIQPVSGGADDGFVAKFKSDGPTVTRYEEDAATYRGYWPTYGAETGSFSGGAIVASNQSTATATFSFSGTAVSWIGVKCNVCGIATVSIDGGAPTTVDTFGPGVPGSLTSEVLYSASGLAPDATHTLVILVTGGGVAAPGFLTGSAYVAVDAFDVMK